MKGRYVYRASPSATVVEVPTLPGLGQRRLKQLTHLSFTTILSSRYFCDLLLTDGKTEKLRKA